MNKYIFFLLILAIVPMVQGNVCLTPVENLTINSTSVLCPGTFTLTDSDANGAIRINANNLTLSCNNTVLIGGNVSNSRGINLLAFNNITVANCTIKSYLDGIYSFATGKANLFIRNNTMREVARGIVIRGYTNTTIQYNDIRHNNSLASTPQGVVIYGTGGNHNISYNVIDGFKHSIRVIEANPNTNIYLNNVSNTFTSGWGLTLIDTCDNSNIYANRIINMSWNSIEMDVKNFEVYDNYLESYKHHGIDLSGGTLSHQTENGLIYNNFVTNRDHADSGIAAIYVKSTTNVTVRNNELSQLPNSYSGSSTIIGGISVEGLNVSSDVYIFNNSIFNVSGYCMQSQANNTIFENNTCELGDRFFRIQASSIPINTTVINNFDKSKLTVYELRSDNTTLNIIEDREFILNATFSTGSFGSVDIISLTAPNNTVINWTDFLITGRFTESIIHHQVSAVNFLMSPNIEYRVLDATSYNTLKVNATNFADGVSVLILNATAQCSVVSASDSTTNGTVYLDVTGNRCNVTVDSPAHLPRIYRDLYINLFNDTEKSFADAGGGCSFVSMANIYDEDWDTFENETCNNNFFLYSYLGVPQHISDLQTVSYNLRVWTSDGSCAGCTTATYYKLDAVNQSAGAGFIDLIDINGADYPHDTWHNITIELPYDAWNGSQVQIINEWENNAGTTRWAMAEDAIIVNPSYSLNATWDALTIMALNITGSILTNFTVTVTDLNLSMNQSATTTGNNITFNLTGGHTYRLMFNKSDTYNFVYDTATIGQGQNYHNFTVYHYPGVSNCSSPFNTTALNITIWDENSPTTALVSTMKATFRVWWEDFGTVLNYSFDLSGKDNYQFCLYPPHENFSTDAYFEYATDNGFTHRYYLVNYTLSNTTTHIRMYNFNTTTGVSDLAGITRHEETYNSFSNVVTQLQRYYTGENVWRTVQMDESGDFGLVFFNIYEESVIYRLKFFDRSNHLLDETEDLKFKCDPTTNVCDLSFLLSEWTGESTATNLIINSSYVNSTGMIYIDWTDPTGRTSTVRLLVTKETLTGTATICNSEQSGAAGSMTCNASAYSGEFLLRVFGSASPETAAFHEWITRQASAKLGDFITRAQAGIYAFFIVGTITLASVFNAIAGIITLLFAIIIIYFTGMFDALTITAITTIAVMAIVVGLLLDKGRRS